MKRGAVVERSPLLLKPLGLMIVGCEAVFLLICLRMLHDLINSSNQARILERFYLTRDDLHVSPDVPTDQTSF